MHSPWLCLLLLTGCAAQSWNCEDYGVAKDFNGMGQLVSIQELPDSEIERICGPRHIGCSIKSVDTVRVYYRAGDECTMRHELCHVMHGNAHTSDYNTSLSPRRVCPA